MIHRRMGQPRFQQQQWAKRYDPHVAPINRLIDDLASEAGAGIPYVAPLYGGIESRILFVFQDPGPATNAKNGGSGFLCSENDDPSAELFATCLEEARLNVSDVMTWNAYPWNLPKGQERPKAGQLDAGVEPLRRVLSLMPRLKVVVNMGRVAQEAWPRFSRVHPVKAGRYAVLAGPHTSRRGITGGGQHSKDEGVTMVLAAMRSARRLIS